jgi:uncharacterized protein (TIGR00369 family)
MCPGSEVSSYHQGHACNELLIQKGCQNQTILVWLVNLKFAQRRHYDRANFKFATLTRLPTHSATKVTRRQFCPFPRAQKRFSTQTMASYPSDQAQAAGAADDSLARAQAMVRFTPQAQALGMQLTRIEGPRAWGLVPYRADLVGDPDTGVIAGGVLTTFLDQLSGVAAVIAMEAATAVATLDLRIDYMRPAEPGRDIRAEAHCVRLTRSVAFVRAVAFEDGSDSPIAHAMAAFMIAGARKTSP